MATIPMLAGVTAVLTATAPPPPPLPAPAPFLFMSVDDVRDSWGLITPVSNQLTNATALRPPPANFTAGATVIACFALKAGGADVAEAFIAIGRAGEPFGEGTAPSSSFALSLSLSLSLSPPPAPTHPLEPHLIDLDPVWIRVAGKGKGKEEYADFVGVRILRYTTADFVRWSAETVVLSLPDGWLPRQPKGRTGLGDGLRWTAKSIARSENGEVGPLPSRPPARARPPILGLSLTLHVARAEILHSGPSVVSGQPGTGLTPPLPVPTHST